MKKANIKVGGVYTDGKGGVRQVVAQGAQYVLYPTQVDQDNLRYRVVAKKRGPLRVGEECNSTRASFAAWAVAEVVLP